LFVSSIALSAVSYSFDAKISFAQGAVSSMDCQNIFGVTAVEHLIRPNFGYILRRSNYAVLLDSSPVKNYNESIGGIVAKTDVFPGKTSRRASLIGSISAQKLTPIYAPGSSIPRGVRVTTGTIPVSDSVQCFPQPNAGGGGNGGGGNGGGGNGGAGNGGGTCGVYCTSSLVNPNSVVSQGVIGGNSTEASRVATLQEDGLNLGHWQGNSWAS
jgi:hypothetical protein